MNIRLKIGAIVSTLAALALAMPGVASAGEFVGPFYPTADTYVSSAHVSSNYGTSNRLWVQNDTEQNYTFLKFDLNDVKTSYGNPLCTEGTAGGTLYMKVDAVSDGGHRAWLGADSTWTETGLKWNNMPAIRLNAYNDPIELTTSPTLSAYEDSLSDWTFVNLADVLGSACQYNDGILTIIIKDGSSDAIAWKSSRATSDLPYAYFNIGD